MKNKIDFLYPEFDFMISMKLFLISRNILNNSLNYKGHDYS